MRSSLAALAFAATFASVAVHAAETASLTVKIENVADKGGDLRVGVYDHDTFVVRGAKPLTGQIVPAKAGSVTVTFNGLKPGEYGVKVLQDENRNGTMDMAMMGMMPAEPYGMSNNAKPAMSGPPWDDAKFTLKPGSNSIDIALH